MKLQIDHGIIMNETTGESFERPLVTLGDEVHGLLPEMEMTFDGWLQWCINEDESASVFCKLLHNKTITSFSIFGEEYTRKELMNKIFKKMKIND